MMQQTQRSLGLFVDHDVLGIIILNGIVPRLIEQSYKPIILNANSSRNCTPRVPHPEVSKFFNNTILDKVILPFISAQPLETLKRLSPRQLAMKHALSYHDIGDPNDRSVLETLSTEDCYMGTISQRFSQIFNAQSVDYIRQRGFFWNMHSGLIPAYKGLLTLYPAIKNKEDFYGMTLHEVAHLVDDGAIIDKTKIPLPHEKLKPIFELYLDTAQSGIDMLTRYTGVMATEGYVETTPQTGLHADGYYTNPTTEEFRKAAEDGIIYADFKRMPSLLADLFTYPGTLQNQALQSRIEDFIERRICDFTNVIHGQHTRLRTVEHG